MARVLLPLAPGFEEIEAITVADVLRRAGVDVVVAALDTSGSVQGSHGITVQAEASFSDVCDEPFDLLVLPGGEPGVTHLGGSAALAALLRRRAKAGQPIAAICAAPRLLAREGLLRHRAATSHPSVAAALQEAGARYDDGQPVVLDGSILTSRGPGTALEFSLALLDLLGLGERAAALRRAMLVPPA
jgi:4-methyl-5(b-hydroxyethyl)-thiazole monophosphate biosynthesis